MTTKPKTRKAAPADPIFALIAAVKAAEKEMRVLMWLVRRLMVRAERLARPEGRR
jgi:hypothetical protein